MTTLRTITGTQLRAAYDALGLPPERFDQCLSLDFAIRPDEGNPYVGVFWHDTGYDLIDVDWSR